MQGGMPRLHLPGVAPDMSLTDLILQALERQVNVWIMGWVSWSRVFHGREKKLNAKDSRKEGP